MDELPERAPPTAAVRGRWDSLGLIIADVSPEMARKLSLPRGLRGPVVSEVWRGEFAAEAGLRWGDVIQELSRRPLRSTRDVARALEQADARRLLARVSRGGGTANAGIERGG